MARILTIAQNKGGVGKTTTAVNMGAALRARGYDVLLIDYDGQANATDTLRAAGTPTMYDVMKQPQRVFQPVQVVAPDRQTGCLDILPSCADVAALEVELSQERDRLTRFRDVVERYRTDYDVVIIDTPPTMGLITISTLYAADDVIIPVQPEYLAVKGLINLRNTLDGIDGNRTLALNKYVLFTQYDARKSLHRLATEQVGASGFRTFTTKIRDNVALGEAPAAGLDIFSYDRRSKGAQDYAALTDEYVQAVKLKHHRHGRK